MDTNKTDTTTVSTNQTAESKPVEQTADSNVVSAPASTPSPSVNKDIFAEFASKIIKEQEGIIGPVAYEQAMKVPGLSLDPKTHTVTLNGDKKVILENLVKQYELLFGRVSIEICKEAVRSMIPQAPTDQVPQILL